MIYKVKIEFSKEFLQVRDNEIIMGIKSKPIKGEANKEMIKKLAKHFRITTMRIQIKLGHETRDKIIKIS